VEFLPDGRHAEACESRETVPKRTRQNHTSAFKAQVALAAIKGDRTLAQLFHANKITRGRPDKTGVVDPQKKWSDSRYVFDIKEDGNAKEAF
jgi:hypothetical protein